MFPTQDEIKRNYTIGRWEVSTNETEIVPSTCQMHHTCRSLCRSQGGTVHAPDTRTCSRHYSSDLCTRLSWLQLQSSVFGRVRIVDNHIEFTRLEERLPWKRMCHQRTATPVHQKRTLRPVYIIANAAKCKMQQRRRKLRLQEYQTAPRFRASA